MTVVIGHPRFVREHITAREINEAVRTYNSHLSRIQVMTYQELRAGAEQVLRLSWCPPRNQSTE